MPGIGLRSHNQCTLVHFRLKKFQAPNFGARSRPQGYKVPPAPMYCRRSTMRSFCGARTARHESVVLKSTRSHVGALRSAGVSGSLAGAHRCLPVRKLQVLADWRDDELPAREIRAHTAKCELRCMLTVLGAIVPLSAATLLKISRRTKIKRPPSIRLHDRAGKHGRS